LEILQRSGKNLTYLVAQPDDFHPESKYPVVMFLHGFGANMYDLINLAQEIDPGKYIYVFPNAPVPVAINPTVSGFSWTRYPGTLDENELRDRQGLIVELIEDITSQYQVNPGKVILGGFSQGALLTYIDGLTNPDKFAGLICLSGIEIDQNIISSLPHEHRSQQLFIAHGINDPVVSINSARRTRDILEKANYSINYNEYPIGHSISQEVINDLIPWIETALNSPDL